MDNDFPVLDGVAPSWADVGFSFKGYRSPLLTMKDISAFSSGSTLERGVQRGASGGRVMKVTTGQLTNEASMTLYRSGWQNLLANLSPGMPSRGVRKLAGLVFFDVEIFHSVPNDPTVYHRKVKGCCINGNALALAEGTDAEVLEIPLLPKEIIDVVNGVEYSLL